MTRKNPNNVSATGILASYKVLTFLPLLAVPCSATHPGRRRAVRADKALGTKMLEKHP